MPNEQHKSSTTYQYTLWQSIAVGGALGVFEVGVNHPLWSIKLMQQQGMSVREIVTQASVRSLYQGIMPNAMSMIPTTAIQVALNDVTQRVIFHNAPMSSSERLACAFSAGYCSSLVSNPTELLITRMRMLSNEYQRPYTMLDTLSYLRRTRGLSYWGRGMPATGIRDGIFAAGFLAGPETLHSAMMSLGLNDNVASMASWLGSGVAAAVLSHPVDTVKTIQQSAPINDGVFFFKIAKELFKNEGVNGFFKGVAPRGLRVVSALTLMGWAKDSMQQLVRVIDESYKDNSLGRGFCP